MTSEPRLLPASLQRINQRLIWLSRYFHAGNGGGFAALPAVYDVFESVLHEVCHHACLGLSWELPATYADHPAPLSSQVSWFLKRDYSQALLQEVYTLAVETLLLLDLGILDEAGAEAFVREITVKQNLRPDTPVVIRELRKAESVRGWGDEVYRFLEWQGPMREGSAIDLGGIDA